MQVNHFFYGLQKISRLNYIKRYGGFIPVVLLQDLEKRGKKGDLIKVRRGHARNHLVPKGIAGNKQSFIHSFIHSFIY
jgi:hypothetical protein